MTRHERAVRDLLDVLAVHPRGGWSWFGRRVDPPRAEVATASVGRSAAVPRLRDHLYESFYVHGSPVPSRDGAPAGEGDGGFAARLAAACAGRMTRQPGWVIVSVGPDGVELEKDGLRVWASADEVVNPAGGGLVAGARVEVLVPSVLEAAQAGYLVLLGDRTLAQDDDVDRFYWHVRGSAAPRLAGELAAELNRRSVPFRFKALAAAEAYVRCDAAVLYALRSDRERVTTVARAVRGRIEPGLVPATPALTERLADGLAMAEEPPDGESFGMHRCGLIAEALLSAAERDLHDPDARLALVRERFARDGIDLDAPWRSGSAR